MATNKAVHYFQCLLDKREAARDTGGSGADDESARWAAEKPLLLAKLRGKHGEWAKPASKESKELCARRREASGSRRRRSRSRSPTPTPMEVEPPTGVYVADGSSPWHDDRGPAVQLEDVEYVLPDSEEELEPMLAEIAAPQSEDDNGVGLLSPYDTDRESSVSGSDSGSGNDDGRPEAEQSSSEEDENFFTSRDAPCRGEAAGDDDVTTDDSDREGAAGGLSAADEPGQESSQEERESAEGNGDKSDAEESEEDSQQPDEATLQAEAGSRDRSRAADAPQRAVAGREVTGEGGSRFRHHVAGRVLELDELRGHEAGSAARRASFAHISDHGRMTDQAYRAMQARRGRVAPATPLLRHGLSYGEYVRKVKRINTRLLPVYYQALPRLPSRCEHCGDLDCPLGVDGRPAPPHLRQTDCPAFEAALEESRDRHTSLNKMFRRHFCAYTGCERPWAHLTRMCPYLMGRCGRCGCRGHTVSLCARTASGRERQRAMFLKFAGEGLFTRTGGVWAYAGPPTPLEELRLVEMDGRRAFAPWFDGKPFGVEDKEEILRLLEYAVRGCARL